jgi:hypothetical protein
MRILTAAGLAGVALAALVACNKPAAAPGGATPSPSAAPAASGPLSVQAMPHRKPGLWRNAIAIEGDEKAAVMSDVCLDQASEAKQWERDQRTSTASCPSRRFSRNLDGSISFNITCEPGPNSKTVTTGTVSDTSYKAVIATTMGGPSKPAGGAHKMTLTSTWIGPCAPGQKGGDVIMANGKKVNLNDATAKARGTVH